MTDIVAFTAHLCQLITESVKVDQLLSFTSTLEQQVDFTSQTDTVLLFSREL